MKLETIFDHVIDGDAEAVEADVKVALESGISADEILKDALIAAMDDVGQRFEDGEFFVPEMLSAARAMKAGLVLLKPLTAKTDTKLTGTVALGTVKGDMHDIGKNLVGMMLEGAGYAVIDLGTDVDPSKFVDAIRNGANVVGLSALLTTTMTGMVHVIKAIEAANLRDKVKIIIGGAPVNIEFAERIGADGFAGDASSAVKMVRELLA